MALKCNNMPGIVEVRWIKMNKLSPNMEAKALAGLPLAVLEDSYIIHLVCAATCVCESEHDNNGRSSKAVLTFSTTDALPNDPDVAWLARQANGQWWLIGTAERPSPTVKINQSAGSPDGEPAVKSVEITHQGVISMIPVAV